MDESTVEAGVSKPVLPWVAEKGSDLRAYVLERGGVAVARDVRDKRHALDQRAPVPLGLVEPAGERRCFRGVERAHDNGCDVAAFEGNNVNRRNDHAPVSLPVFDLLPLGRTAGL